jgi:hypothetical protein
METICSLADIEREGVHKADGIGYVCTTKQRDNRKIRWQDA